MNTRFNPTCNGDPDSGILHIGHAALIYLNAEVAKQSGGRFVLRFDDNQAYWVDKLGRPYIGRVISQIKREIEWMGVEWQEETRHSENASLIDIVLTVMNLGFFMARDPIIGYPISHVPNLTRFNSPQYPYAPYLTAEVVILDAISQIDTVIVGEELMSRFSLYCYLCEALKNPIPTHYHVPRLMERGTQHELAPVSKTVGNFKIKRYMDNGMNTSDFKYSVASHYLHDLSHGWSLDNVAKEPVIDVNFNGNV